jgi:hypothetical protein
VIDNDSRGCVAQLSQASEPYTLNRLRRPASHFPPNFVKFLTKNYKRSPFKVSGVWNINEINGTIKRGL